MDKATAVQRLVMIVAIAVTSSTSAQVPPHQRACSVADETVMVKVQEVPDLKQRCYEVVYENQKGYVCVWAGGTPERPYGFTENFSPEHVTKEGWTGAGGGSVGCKADSCFRSLCSRLVKKHREEEERTKFDPDAAAEFPTGQVLQTAGCFPDSRRTTRMNWLRDNAAVLGLGGSLLIGIVVLFVEYGPLEKKSEVEALERVLRSGLVELAKCVDNPQYVSGG